MLNSRVDRDDVPYLVQELRYEYETMAFMVRYCNGAIDFIPAESLFLDLDLDKEEFDQGEYEQISFTIEAMALWNWNSICLRTH